MAVSLESGGKEMIAPEEMPLREKRIHRKEHMKAAAKSVPKAYQTYRSFDAVIPKKEVAKCFFKEFQERGLRRG